ncbi:MAG: hypothetical protein WA240_12055 [Nitrospirota bacterium]
MTNPFVTRSTFFNDPFNDPNIRNNPESWETIDSRTSSFKIFMSNPFVQVAVGTSILILITIVNVILR